MISDADIEKAARAIAAKERLSDWAMFANAARVALEAVGYHSWMPIDDDAKDGAHILIASNRLDSGCGVAQWDETWNGDGWWIIEDGKNTEIPLRGDAPTHYKPLGDLPTC
jgi:hypothetical protein